MHFLGNVLLDKLVLSVTNSSYPVVININDHIFLFFLKSAILDKNESEQWIYYIKSCDFLKKNTDCGKFTASWINSNWDPDYMWAKIFKGQILCLFFHWIIIKVLLLAKKRTHYKINAQKKRNLHLRNQLSGFLNIGINHRKTKHQLSFT